MSQVYELWSDDGYLEVNGYDRIISCLPTILTKHEMLYGFAE